MKCKDVEGKFEVCSQFSAEAIEKFAISNPKIFSITPDPDALILSI
jgi:hypothetical protein